MSDVAIFLITEAITLVIAIGVALFIRRHFRNVLTDLTGTAERAAFWSAFTSLLLVLVPLIVVMFVPRETESGEPMFFRVVAQLIGSDKTLWHIACTQESRTVCQPSKRADRFQIEGDPTMWRILPLLVALCLGFTPSPAAGPPKPGPSDLEKMQGTWYRTRLIIAGEDQDETPGEVKIEIKGTHLQFPTPEDSWTITLDPKHDPKWIDRRGNKRPNTDTIYRGIYRLEDHTLTICSVRNGDEKDRPTNFESTGGAVWLQVFKRKRP